MLTKKHCDNDECQFSELIRPTTAIKTYKIVMQNETDSADVMYHHSVDLCPGCVVALRGAMKEVLKINWVVIDPKDRKNVAGGGVAIAPATPMPVKNQTGVGTKYNYLNEKDASPKPVH